MKLCTAFCWMMSGNDSILQWITACMMMTYSTSPYNIRVNKCNFHKYFRIRKSGDGCTSWAVRFCSECRKVHSLTILESAENSDVCQVSCKHHYIQDFCYWYSDLNFQNTELVNGFQCYMHIIISQVWHWVLQCFLGSCKQGAARIRCRQGSGCGGLDSISAAYFCGQRAWLQPAQVAENWSPPPPGTGPTQQLIADQTQQLWHQGVWPDAISGAMDGNLTLCGLALPYNGIYLVQYCFK